MHTARLLALAVLGLSAYAYWQSYSPAWRWAIGVAMVLAVVVGARAVAERKQVLGQPLSVKVSSFYVLRLFLPVVVVLLGLVGLFAGPGELQTAAIIMAVCFALGSTNAT